MEKVGRSPKSSDESEVFVLDGLEPDTEYITRVEVQSFDKSSQSPDATFKTREFCLFYDATATRIFHNNNNNTTFV